MTHPDAQLHVRGESIFVDDMQEPAGLLWEAVCFSSKAHAKITQLDLSLAESSTGVVKILTAKDIPGQNQIGGIIQDEPLLADGEVHYAGQPIACVIAQSFDEARDAANKIIVEYQELEPILDPRVAASKGQLIAPARTFSLGSVDGAWSKCATIVEGRVDSSGQEHIYLETQGSMAFTDEQGRIRVYSGTQSPTAVQRTIARVLGLAMNAVEVDVKRLGGGFGGKEDQATAWACLAALGAYHLKRPVKIILSRHDDIRMTGKRHPYSSDFIFGLDAKGTFVAYEVTFYQNSGAAADLSTAILERTLFHATNTYFIPNVKATAFPCRTNLVPFTAFRGFGGPQGMFVMEAAIAKAAEVLNVDAWELQKKNLLKTGDEFPYGMKIKKANARRCFAEAVKRYNFSQIRKDARVFNRQNKLTKRGVAIMPICFGISFTNTFLNQASSLVHVYTDGSVHISAAAVEMGQGVNSKLIVIASQTLGVPAESIFVDSTNTTRVANTSPTAASSAADLNGRATQMACEMILNRLKTFVAQKNGCKPQDVRIENGRVCATGSPPRSALAEQGQSPPLEWKDLIWQAHVARINLSAQALYATPDIFFDKTKEKGTPFAYHVFGTAIFEATVDCLRGTYTVDAVHIVHDVGKSLDPLIDRGQVEGALLQGIGWMTCEELVFSDDGLLVSNTLSTYKVPDLYSAPKKVDVTFLEDAANPFAVMGSKGVGEPPLMYGIGAYFALRNAMRAYRPETFFELKTPMTPERVLMAINELTSVRAHELTEK